MTSEEHLFFAKYLFNKSVEIKKSLRLPLQVHECSDFASLEPKWREFYGNLAWKYAVDYKLDIEKYLPF